MIHRSVETVYVVSGAGDDAMLRYLSQTGVNIIAGQPPLTDIQDHWVASLRFSVLESFEDYWPDFIAGSATTEVTLPLQITDINPALLSPGKQRLVEEILSDVLAGYIDLEGVDLTNP